MSLQVIILAAGKGTRMRSSLPKVLHKLADKSLLEHVIHTAKKLNPDKIVVVYGHGGEIVPKTLAHLEVDWILQEQQLGTGHAVDEAMGKITSKGRVLVLYGDVPLTKVSTLQTLLAKKRDNDQSLSLLTARLNDPTGYGRIVRNSQEAVIKIVEQKDANDNELEINEINTGILCADATSLKHWLKQLDNNNAQQEFYLTDIVEKAVSENIAIDTASAENIWEIEGVNNKRQLANLERVFQSLTADSLMERGVTLRDPNRIDVRGNLSCGQDVVIDVNVVFEGDVTLGNEVYIGANSLIKNAIIGDSVNVVSNSIIENAVVGNGCEIGPFARIRPDTKLEDGVKVGNFVEVKKSNIGEGSKINHLSYVGDTIMGQNVNVGAGTITCNYDGANKHITEIGDNVFVGSSSQLVAPVKIGSGATIGAGSTITRDVPESKLTLSRSKQTTITSWIRPVKPK